VPWLTEGGCASSRLPSHECERDGLVGFTWAHSSPDGLLFTLSPFIHFNRADYLGGPNDAPFVPMSYWTKARSFRKAAIALGVCALFLSCHSEHQTTARRFKLRGTVVSVDRQGQQAVINHEEIPGFMAAMTMGYKIKDEAALRQLQPGDQITAEVVVTDNESWLENVVIVKKASASGSIPSSQLRQPEPGENVPDFLLVNQDGKRVHFRRYRGKSVLLTFIYTRCPLPDYCPRMNSNLAEINHALAKDKRLFSATHLLSISFDPEYDTPKVLRAYAAQYTARDDPGFRHWEFAVVPANELKEVARYFGLSYWQEAGQIVHSMSTTLIGPDGKLYRWYPGNEWKVGEVLKDIQEIRDRSSAL